MNPSSAGMWCNPPPPGTDEDLSNASVKRESPERPIDRIDPFLKSSEYVKYERKHEHRRRSRSRSRHRRHRSKSRGRHKHRRRRYSSSRSRSRSRRHKRRTRSKSRSRSRSHRRKRRSRSRKRSRSHQKAEPQVEKTKVEEEVEEEEDDGSNENQFKNDGSFMEMFKRMQEEEQKKKEAETAAAETKPAAPAFGKRRGGKVLKTGMVQKNKTASQEEADAQDAWTLYMNEVKRYKEACCDDDSKTRLLVK